jgi:hypothetical protein
VGYCGQLKNTRTQEAGGKQMLRKLLDNKSNNVEFYIKMLVVIFAAIMPLFFIFSVGYKFSISSYWETSMQPLFILINASTSYHLFAVRSWRWRPSAIMLLALTAFSVTEYADAHNILAVLFFVSCLIPLYITHHYRHFFWIYLATLPIMIFDMMAGESFAIFTLCVYHGLMLLKIRKIKNRHK